jgi:putative inorganic carbon (HCO3(-)) transporter
VSGAFRNEQLLAAFLCLMLPLAVTASFAQPELWQRLLAQVTVVTLGGCLMLAQNRSAWAGAAAGLTVLAILHALRARRDGWSLPPRQQLIIPALIVTLAAGLFLAAGRMGFDPSQRAKTLQALNRDPTTQWRMGMWSKAVRMVRDRPVTGWGLGSFALEQARYYHPAIDTRSQREIARSGASLGELAHNTYLHVAAETGVVGLVLYLAVLSSVTLFALRAAGDRCSLDRRPLLFGCVAGIAAQAASAFASPAWELAECSLFLWLLLGFAVAAAGIGREGLTPLRASERVARGVEEY